LPELTIEEAVAQSCGALMSGDIMRLMTDFTPEALTSLMASASSITSVPALTGFDIQSHDTDGDQHIFRILFKTSEGDVTAHATYKDVDGFWKITNLTIDGLPGAG
jgi:hypothetical protein